MALVLRTCKSDLSSYGGFRWPSEGPVECPDWDPTPECGRGLHGLLGGCGDGSLLDWSESARWLVVEVNDMDIVDLGGKVKFSRGLVVHCGDRKSATDYLLAAGCTGPIVGASVVVGDRGQATVGDYGHAVAGIRGHAIAGDGGHATAGDYGEGGLKAGVSYRLNAENEFEEVVDD